MKKRINLLKKQETQHSLLVKKINFYGTIAAICLFVVVLSFFFLQLSLSTKTQQLTEEKTQLTKSFTVQNQRQLEINYINSKEQQLKTFLKDDAQFSVYYNMLRDIFLSNNLPMFTSLVIDANQNISFSFRLVNSDDMKKVINFIESDDFLSRFSALRIHSAIINTNSNGTQQIDLEFAGTLKKQT